MKALHFMLNIVKFLTKNIFYCNNIARFYLLRISVLISINNYFCAIWFSRKLGLHALLYDSACTIPKNKTLIVIH